MSKDVNKVILIGRAGRDPEIVSLTDGKQLARVSIATSEKWKDKNSGEQRESTQWHSLIFFGPLVEVVEKYVKKGMLLYVEGKIQYRKTDEGKYYTDIRVSDVNMLSYADDKGDRARGSATGSASAANKPGANKPAQQANPQAEADFDDDIPF